MHIKPIKMENTQSLDYVCYVFSLNFLTVNEIAAKRHLIVGAAKLNQHIYFKSILISKFESKDVLLWKRDSGFASTQDENLWIPSKLM